MVRTLTQVGESHDVTCLLVVTAFVGDPHLDLVDRSTRCDVRHRLHGLFVMIAEEMGEEEMAVLVVVVTRDVELRHLGTALTAHCLRLAVLLTDQGLDLKLTELQVGLDTEQSLTASDQRAGQVHCHVTCFDGLDDIVFLAFVVQLQVLLVKRERCLGVITEVEIQFRSHFTLNGRLDLLVKIEDVVISRA